mgnify:FL=1
MGRPERVFFWLEDPARAMEWMTSVTKTEIVHQAPNTVGTTFREYIEEKGRGTQMRGVVTDFVKNERIAFHLEGDFGTVEVDFTLEGKEEVTQLTRNAEIRFKGVSRVMSFFFGFYIKKKIIRQARSEFAKLKELCEY